MIDQFKLYRESHPNLSQCWITYLGLKKRHYDEETTHQCNAILESFKNGCPDWNQKDIISILLYKQSLKTSAYNL
jgi:hypothetical protein